MSEETATTQMPTGILFTRRELAYIDSSLERLGQDYYDGGKPELMEEIERLRKRLKESNTPPKGMSEDRHTFWGQRIMLAMRDHGPGSDQIAQITKDYWAEMLRVETKPAEVLATSFGQLAAAFQSGGMIGAIQIFGAKLTAAEKRHPEGTPLAEELGQWLVAGETSLQKGENPWPDDTDIRPSEAPESE